MAECVKVIVRCRPLNDREKGMKCANVISVDAARGQCSITNPQDKKVPPKMFTFDGAYFMESTTEQIYGEVAYPLVEGVTEGYNGTIFAYGQTGSGKSFSMQGLIQPPSQKGIIPRAFAHIFETISLKQGTKFLIHASFLEIYNEEIRDLLGKDVKHRLELKEHPEKGVYVNGLSMHPVHNVAECEHIMNKGWHNRSTGATLMNADSSRSHSIFTISLEMVTKDAEGEDHIRAGKLNLVDLAGSERQGKTGATGDRLKEATKINLSLSALGNVISALVDGKSKHIPYRDSKLTRLLQDSLGGNTKTMMVACLSPADNNYDETLSTLRYAHRAKNIKNKPKINEDPKDALLRQYQEEIEKLKAMLAGQIPVQMSLSASGTTGVHDNVLVHEELEQEKNKLKEEYEVKMTEMKAAFEAEKSNKAKLQQDMDKLRAFYDSKLKTMDGHLAHLPSTAQVLGEEKMAEAAFGNIDTSNDKGEKKNYKSASPPRPLSTSSQDISIIGPDISDIGRPMILGPDGLPHVEKEGPVREDKIVEEESSLKEQQEQHQHDQQQQQQHQKEKQEVPNQNVSSVGVAEMADKHKKVLARLLALQQQMVGGENANNVKVKEEHDRKLKHAQSIRKKLDEVNKNLEDDGIMLSIFDSVQDELRTKNKILEERKTRIESLERDIIDIQSEFEFDRMDYLDTIRKQDRQIAYLESLVDRIHPCLRRDCNYYNLDRIRLESHYNEEEEKWIMPKMMIDRTVLPMTGTILPNARMDSHTRTVTGEYDGDGDDERLREKLRRSEDKSHIFQPKRAAQLINSNEPISKFSMHDVRTSMRPTMPLSSPTINGYHVTDEPISKDLRAAQVHGQLYSDEMVRKPVRLDALPSMAGKKSRKKRNNLDSL